MYRIVLLLALITASAYAGSADTDPPVTKHIEIAGTIVVGSDGVLVMRSNGHEYVLALGADEPGVNLLKTGLALIAKGTLTIEGPDDEKTRTLRPDVLIIRGRSYNYENPPVP